MTRALRIAYVLLAWLYLAGLVAVAFAAGLGLLVPGSTMQLHRESGYILHLAPILLLLAAWGARVGRPTVWWVVARPCPASSSRCCRSCARAFRSWQRSTR